MIHTRIIKHGLLILASLAAISSSVFAQEYRLVTDLRGKQVRLPATINRVVTIDDGLTEAVITILGESDKIVGLGSKSLRKTSRFSIPNHMGSDYLFENCMNPVRLLNPGFAQLPLIKDASGINFESLAGLAPDVVIIRAGSCSASWGTSSHALDKNVAIIESLGIPAVVLLAPSCNADPTLDNIPSEIRLIGQIFGEEEKAAGISRGISSYVAAIKKRTTRIPDSKKPSVLALGLSPKARSAGGAGNVRSGIIKYYIEEIVNAKSAFTVKYHTPDTGLINMEQVFAMDPDIIILTTSFGYHPPEELYNAPYYRNFQDLRAVKDRAVSALPFTPANCDASRLEHPIDLMVIAKTSYPEHFRDIKVHEWILDFYQTIYGVDLKTAEKMRSVQLLDWTVASDF